MEFAEDFGGNGEALIKNDLREEVVADDGKQAAGDAVAGAVGYG